MLKREKTLYKEKFVKKFFIMTTAVLSTSCKVVEARPVQPEPGLIRSSEIVHRGTDASTEGIIYLLNGASVVVRRVDSLQIQAQLVRDTDHSIAVYLGPVEPPTLGPWRRMASLPAVLTFVRDTASAVCTVNSGKTEHDIKLNCDHNNRHAHN